MYHCVHGGPHFLSMFIHYVLILGMISEFGGLAT